MAPIDQIIRQEINPFDPATFQTGNFWQERQDQAITVDSIHQSVITQIEGVLDQVAKDHYPRTLLLAGDSGSGKSYLLARLKRTLNPKAFFAYIGPWPDSDYIWRHILRQTVDSLMHVPEGKHDSQLLLWLNSLPAFKKSSLMKQLLGEQKKFISDLTASYPSGIYNPREFFKVLYHLTNPELHALACYWLRGDELDEADLKELGVRRLIDTEDAAQKVLANFGRISASSQPIVLCFDQLDNIPRFPDGSLDLQALFNVNSSIHTRYPQNLLVIISIITSTWRENKDRIQPADITEGRVMGALSLKPITLEQAEALWATRLYPLHQQAEPQPNSPIYPLTQQALEEKFPRGKTTPRYALRLGRQLLQEYKAGLVPDVPITPKLKPETPSPKPPTPPIDPLAAFDLVWRKEFKKTQQKIDRIPKLGSPELIQMLQEVLSALQVAGIESKLLQKTKYSIYSFSYQFSEQTERIGIVWSEEANLRSFSYLMKACEKALKQKFCDSIILIRAAQLGQSNNAGYRLFKRIFTGSPHRHITPHLNSVHYLATYHSLVNAAQAGDLVVGDLTPNLKELEGFIRDSQILHNCSLLQELGIVPADTGNGGGDDDDKDDDLKKLRQDAKDYLVTLVRNDGMMLGRKTLLENANREYSQLNESQLNPLIDELCQENKLQIPNLNEKLEKQVVCIVMSPQ